MKRAVFLLKCGEYINIPADTIDIKDGWVCAWNGESLVAVAKEEIVEYCKITEQNDK